MAAFAEHITAFNLEQTEAESMILFDQSYDCNPQDSYGRRYETCACPYRPLQFSLFLLPSPRGTSYSSQGQMLSYEEIEYVARSSSGLGYRSCGFLPAAEPMIVRRHRTISGKLDALIPKGGHGIARSRPNGFTFFADRSRASC